jgi:hypothetical protein
MYIGGKRTHAFKMPVESIRRKPEIAFRYGLPVGRYTVQIMWLNPGEGVRLHPGDLIVYRDKPAANACGITGR